MQRLNINCGWPAEQGVKWHVLRAESIQIYLKQKRAEMSGFMEFLKVPPLYLIIRSLLIMYLIQILNTLLLKLITSRRILSSQLGIRPYFHPRVKGKFLKGDHHRPSRRVPRGTYTSSRRVLQMLGSIRSSSRSILWSILRDPYLFFLIYKTKFT